MIRQVIFDVGGVLLTFDPGAMVSTVTSNEADSALLCREIFSHSDWCRLDRGGGEEEIFSSMKARLPARLHPQAEALFAHWHESLRPKREVGELAEELFQLGLPLYILSNAPFRFYRFREKIPAYDRMTGVMLSCEEGLLKPDPELFRRLLNRWHLRPEECFFIDDSPINVESAQWCGMNTFLFRDNVPTLRAALRQAGIPVQPPTREE